MMRKVVAFAAVSSAAADLTCSVNAGGVVSDGLNSALAIWASEKRCQGQWVSLSPVKCVTDISSALASVTHLAASVAGVVTSCDAVRDAHGDCAIAADLLVSDVAGLTASAATITNKCGNVADPKWNGDVLGLKNDLGKCVGDASGTFNGIFAVSNTFERLKANCNDGKCPMTTEDAVGVLASLGASIASAVGDCNHALGKQYDTSTSDCAAAILSGIAKVTNAAKQGAAMKKSCAAPGRLYSEQGPAPSSMPALAALVVALPITAVASFAVGRRFAAKRQQNTVLELEGGMD